MDKFVDIAVDQFQKGWSMLKQAPLALVSVVGLTVLGCWFYFRAHIAHLKDLNDTLSKRVDALEKENKSTHEENEKIHRENQEMAAKLRTSFRMDIRNVNIFTPSGVVTTRTCFLMEVRLWNGGASSVARNWRLELELEDGSLIDTQGSSIPPQLKLDGKPVGDYPDLSEFTARNKVDTFAEGWLMFCGPIAHDLAIRRTNSLVLSVEDVHGKTFKCEQPLSGLLSP
jgi:hypothetical protein